MLNLHYIVFFVNNDLSHLLFNWLIIFNQMGCRTVRLFLSINSNHQFFPGFLSLSQWFRIFSLFNAAQFICKLTATKSVGKKFSPIEEFVLHFGRKFSMTIENRFIPKITFSICCTFIEKSFQGYSITSVLLG